jgi:LmeA-like phospholipid-binding
MRKAAAVGCLTTVVPALVVIGALLFAGDVFARRYATGQLSDRISAAVPEASGVHARIRSFPFVGKLFWDGHVDEVGAHIDRVAVGSVVFTNLDIDLRGVVFDGDAFVTSHRATLTKIRQGTVTASVTARALSAALGRPVHITAGGVNVAVLAGLLVRAGIALTPGRQLVLRVAGLPVVAVPLPSSNVFPCAPRLSVGEGAIVLRCAFTQIPHAFAGAA